MSIHSTNPETRNQHGNRLAATVMKPIQQSSDLMIQQQPGGSSRIKELRSHQGITIKWSLDSASRRRIGLPPLAAVGAVALLIAGVGSGSC
ncbi:hypothetical protein [Kribbella sp. HUAS MG21]|uniref:Uncharacterized protein n=1 Tax=Kribbella sp. HUAS MG21 TaxID=3160966 RepID=A0AAU7TM55_9ACTN